MDMAVNGIDYPNKFAIFRTTFALKSMLNRTMKSINKRSANNPKQKVKILTI